MRWLREDFQVARKGPLVYRAARVRSLRPSAHPRSARVLPGTLAGRTGAVYDLLQRAGQSWTACEIAAEFERPDEALEPVSEALDAIVAIGAAEPLAGDRFRAVS